MSAWRVRLKSVSSQCRTNKLSVDRPQHGPIFYNSGTAHPEAENVPVCAQQHYGSAFAGNVESWFGDSKHGRRSGHSCFCAREVIRGRISFRQTAVSR